MTLRVGRPRRAGFTLVELLVVIGIIALLVSILLPSLAKARQQAQLIKCLSNLRSLSIALQMYASENRQFVPAVNWGKSATSNGKVGAGWLYRTNVTWPFPKPLTPQQAEEGSFFPYLKTLQVYRCPGHSPDLILGKTDSVTSYLMNGGLNGYGRTKLYPITRFKSSDACIWEADERAGSAFNDGSSYPNESFIPGKATAAAYGARHGRYAAIGFIDGHAEQILHEEVVLRSQEPGRNYLWCAPAPDSKNGH